MRGNRGERELVVLFLIFCVGLIFVSRTLFLMISSRMRDTDRIVFLQEGVEPSQTVRNIYLDFWEPEAWFIRDYEPNGFEIESMLKKDDCYEVSVQRKRAEFLISMKDGRKYLFSGSGEMIWIFSDEMDLSDYHAIPEIYNVENFEQAREIISRLSNKSVLFRNYLSSVDAEATVFYMRNANILLVNSWRNLEEFDEDGFIYQMGKNQIYDLFSTGRFFPIKK